MTSSRVSELILEHAQQPYDPVERRRRYLASRHLKGRPRGATQATADSRVGSSSAPLVSQQRQAESEVRDQARVQALQSKLQTLKAHLQSLLDEAKASSTTTSTSTSSKSSGSSTGDKPMTAQEKAAARKASQKYRDTHKDETSKPEPKTTEEKIVQVRATIQKVHDQLSAAIQQARNQTANGR